MHERREVFLSEDEMITDILLYRLTEDDKRQMRQIPASEVKDLCAEWSKPLIEHYRMTDENNPYCIADAMHENYPIKMSYRVVARVWTRLTGKALPAHTPEVPTQVDMWF